MFNPAYLIARIHCPQLELREIFIALLSDIGFDGFEENDALLTAYVPAKDYDESRFLEVLAPFLNEEIYVISILEMEDKNWNEVWESNFEPVLIPPHLWVRSPQHPVRKDLTYNLTILPAMAFVTGHHATTYMMLAAIASLDLEKKSVLDFGTGTGILIILAALKKASVLIGIDNDANALKNTLENIALNDLQNIKLIHADNLADLAASRFNFIFANINRVIITKYFSALYDLLDNKGMILFSGILSSDLSDLTTLAHDHSLKLIIKQEREGWLFLQYQK